MTMTCQCCAQRNEHPVCGLCGWTADPALTATGYSRLNRVSLSRFRVAFLRALPGRIEKALGSMG